jgi:thioredoxin-related protein
MKTVILIFVITLYSVSLWAQQPELKWYSLKEAMELSKKNPKKIFIDMYTDWCGWCKKMDAETFNNPAISKYLTDNFYLVKFDAETRDTITFKDKQYVNKSTGNRPPHELAVELLGGKMSYPTIVYLDENLNPLSAVPGYMTPSDIEPVLIFFSRDIYKVAPFNEFKDNFNKTFKDTVPFVEKVKWVTLEKAEKLNQKNPKKIIVFIYHEWCLDCKIMISTTFNHEIIAKYLNENYYPVKFDITSKDTVRFNGAIFINEQKEHPYHQFAVSLLGGKMNVPQMVFINGQNQLISLVPGYFLPKNVEPVLHFFKDDSYLTKKWEEYVKTFVGEVK